MLRRMAAAAVVVLVLGGFVLADTARGYITKVGKDSFELTPVKFNKEDKKLEKGDAITVKFTKDTKWVAKKDKNDDGKELTLDEVKERVKKAGKNGVLATVEHEDKKASSVTFFAGKAKKKKKDD